MGTQFQNYFDISKNPSRVPFFHFLIMALGILLGTPGLFWGFEGGEPLPGMDPLRALSFSPDEGFSLAGGLLFHSGHPPEQYFLWGGTAWHLLSCLLIKLFLFSGVTLDELMASKGILVIMAGRFLSLLSSVLIASLLFEIARRKMASSFVLGLPLLWLFLPLQIEMASVYRPDLSALLGLAILVWAFSNRDTSLKTFFWGGLGLGMACSFRITNLIFVLSVWPFLLSLKDSRLKKTGLWISGICLGFSSLSFLSFVYWESFLGFYKTWNLFSIQQPELEARFLPAFTVFLTSLLHSTGPLLALLLIPALCFALPNKDPFWKFVLSGLVLSIVISGIQYHYVAGRYWLPFIFFALIVLGHFLFQPLRFGKFSKIILGLVLVCTGVSGMNRFILRMQEDTRKQACNWIKQNVPDQTQLAMLSFWGFNSHPWTDHPGTYFLGRNYKELSGKKSLSEFDADFWVLVKSDLDQVLRLKDKHPFQKEAEYALGLFRGETKEDGKRWRKVAEFRAFELCPPLMFFRYEEPDDFRYVSPVIYVFKKV